MEKRREEEGKIDVDAGETRGETTNDHDDDRRRRRRRKTWKNVL